MKLHSFMFSKKIKNSSTQANTLNRLTYYTLNQAKILSNQLWSVWLLLGVKGHHLKVRAPRAT